MQREPINWSTHDDPYPTTKFSSGTDVDFDYYFQSLSPSNISHSLTIAYIKLTSENEFYDNTSPYTETLSCLINAMPLNGAGVSIKRENSIAQNLAHQTGDFDNGYVHTGSYANEESFLNGQLYYAGGNRTFNRSTVAIMKQLKTTENDINQYYNEQDIDVDP